MYECIFLSPPRLFAAVRTQGAVLLVSFQALELFLYWPVSRCAKSKGKVQTQSPLTNQGGWRRRLGSAGSGGGCAKRSLIAIEIMMVGWIFEREAGCKCRECCVGEESCPSGDEGSGSGMAQRCWSVCINL